MMIFGNFINCRYDIINFIIIQIKQNMIYYFNSDYHKDKEIDLNEQLERTYLFIRYTKMTNGYILGFIVVRFIEHSNSFFEFVYFKNIIELGKIVWNLERKKFIYFYRK